MAFRTSGLFKVAATNTPQPAFGSWITAGAPLLPSQVPVVLTLGTAQNAGNDAAQIFIPGELAWLVDPGGLNAESVRIQSVLNNTVTLGPQTDVDSQGRTGWVTRFPHVSGAIGVGTYIIPKHITNNFLISLEDGGLGAFLFIGNKPTMTSVLWRIYKIAKTAAGVQPGYFSAGMFSPGNALDLSELWVYGTAADLWNVSVMQD